MKIHFISINNSSNLYTSYLIKKLIFNALCKTGCTPGWKHNQNINKHPWTQYNLKRECWYTNILCGLMSKTHVPNLYWDKRDEFTLWARHQRWKHNKSIISSQPSLNGSQQLKNMAPFCLHFINGSTGLRKCLLENEVLQKCFAQFSQWSSN